MKTLLIGESAEECFQSLTTEALGTYTPDHYYEMQTVPPRVRAEFLLRNFSIIVCNTLTSQMTLYVAGFCLVMLSSTCLQLLYTQVLQCLGEAVSDGFRRPSEVPTRGSGVTREKGETGVSTKCFNAR